MKMARRLGTSHQQEKASELVLTGSENSVAGRVVLGQNENGTYALKLLPMAREPLVALGHTASGDVVGLSIQDDEGVPIVGAMRTNDGAAFIRVGKSDGSKAALGVSPKGEVMLGLTDDAGNMRFRAIATSWGGQLVTLILLTSRACC